jgi:hypothetical protein
LALNRLTPNFENQRKALFAYLVAGAFATFALAHLLYELNIDWTLARKLPLWDFYSEQLVPFLVTPFRWVGIDLHDILEPLLVLSGLGAALWTGAEYRRGVYLALYPFPKLQRRPGDVEFGDWSEPPKVREPPPMLLRWIARIAQLVLLKYTFLGLIAVVPGVLAGLRAGPRYVYEVWLLVAGNCLYVIQHFLAPYERWDEQDHPDTKRFLLVYNLRADMEERLHGLLQRPPLIPVSEVGTIKPLVKTLLADSARVFAIALGLIGLAAVIELLVG